MQFWVLFGGLYEKFEQQWQKSGSPELLIVQTWLTPYFNWKSHLSNSVSYNLWPSDPQKWSNFFNGKIIGF